MMEFIQYLLGKDWPNLLHIASNSCMVGDGKLFSNDYIKERIHKKQNTADHQNGLRRPSPSSSLWLVKRRSNFRILKKNLIRNLWWENMFEDSVELTEIIGSVSIKWQWLQRFLMSYLSRFEIDMVILWKYNIHLYELILLNSGKFLKVPAKSTRKSTRQKYP